MNAQKVKVLVQNVSERWEVCVSRVPCVGESIIVRHKAYDVREVIHHTNGDEYAAELIFDLATADK
ncbi:hypothetical protein [Candidatus Binatus sp.]|uniref:hypothetical protein n=1 Tax=Candidatus Binatus sp. TaxID=2811406 RepID=UPI003C8943DB